MGLFSLERIFFSSLARLAFVPDDVEAFGLIHNRMNSKHFDFANLTAHIRNCRGAFFEFIDFLFQIKKEQNRLLKFIPIFQTKIEHTASYLGGLFRSGEVSASPDQFLFISWEAQNV